MASLRLPFFQIDPTTKPHEPPLVGQEDPTQAATSLQSGTFQYVDSAFLSSSATTAALSNVSASAIDLATGQIYFLRRVSPQIIVLGPAGDIIAEIADPALVAGHSIKLIDAGKGSQLWVADMGSSTIRVYGLDGTVLDIIGPTIGQAPGAVKDLTLGKVTDIAFDGSIGQFYISDGGIGGPYNRVIVLNPSMQYIAVWGDDDIGPQVDVPIKLKVPHAIAIDPWHRIWIVDSENSRVLVANQSGIMLNSWKFPNVALYGISISEDRVSDPSHAMIYLTGDNTSTGVAAIMLLLAVYNQANPQEIGSNRPLTVWDVPNNSLHWISTGSVNGQELAFVSTLSGTKKLSGDRDPPPSVLAYQLSIRRPRFLTPGTGAPPLWPGSFHAVALLHPFEKDTDAFCIAEIWYTQNTRMQWDLYTPSAICVSLLYEDQNGSTQLSVSINRRGYSPPIPSSKVIPTRDWLARGAKFQGQLPLLDVQTNWWYTFAENDTTMWHWFRLDTNVPWRTMNSIDSNPDNIPVLQDFAFINWPTFTANADGLSGHPPLGNDTPTELPPDILNALKNNTSVAKILGALVQLDRRGCLGTTPEERQENLAKLPILIPGFSPGSGGLPPPVWPDQFFMTCTMTAINDPKPMSTEVLYNWPTKLQRTRMFRWEQTSCVDAVLTPNLPSPPAPGGGGGGGHTPGTTYIIERNDQGQSKCGRPIPKIGPPPPDWAAQADAEIVATITDNPQLSPGATTRIFHCPFDKTTQSQFWIWYSDRYAPDTPVVFMQTLPPPQVGTNLALADYQRMQLTELIDGVSYSVPKQCLKMK